MCGFLCVVTRSPVNETMDLASLDRDVLRHRGPDSAGELMFPHAYVRHWRLSIVDVSDGSSQPYGRGSSRLIYNGEIYDYESVAARLSLDVSGDTPLLYELCQRGIEREELKRIRGFYSYLYLRDNGLVLSGARDPFGKKPLFYYLDNEAGIAIFASEERAIVECLRTRHIDFPGVAQYLLYKQVFHGRTFFRDIRQIAPGARFEFDVRRWSFSVDRDWPEYYRMPAAEVFSLGRRDDVRLARSAQLDTLVYEELRESLVLRIPREVSASVALSGGVDSALIAHLTAHTSSLDHISQFVTIGFEAAGADESSRAAEIARALSVGAKHRVVPFPQSDLLACLKQCIEHASAPLEHPHYLSYYVLCRHAATASKVLITGEGADELFMGYDHYLETGVSFAFREYLLRDDEDGFVSDGAFARPFDGIRSAAAVGAWRAGALGSRMQAREYELKSHLLTLLARNDKMGMAHSVEIRAPFLDRHIMELAMALSDDELVVDGSPKRVLKRIFARCFLEIALQEKKIGFRVPFDEAFEAGRQAGELRAHCEAAAAALGKECGLHLRGIESISPRLGWSLLNVGIFLDANGYRP